jgi:hypothetical protein
MSHEAKCERKQDSNAGKGTSAQSMATNSKTKIVRDACTGYAADNN